MKKILIISLACLFCMTCKKNNQQLDHGILITGRIEDTKTKSDKDGLSLSDADKIMVSFGEEYNVIDIDNGSFSLYAPMGSATALIFVNSDLEYIGHLSVAGLNMLPLVNLIDGENTVIDLSTLTLEGNAIYPNNDPVGEEIRISQEFIDLLNELGPFYAAISENIDTDSDGVPDYFSNEHMILNNLFRIDAGKFGVNDSSPVLNPLNLFYFMRIRGCSGLIPDQVNFLFSGPEGNPHPDINYAGAYAYEENCDCFLCVFDRASGLPFADGVYNFSLSDDDIRKLHYYSIDATRFLVYAKPTLISDVNGKVTNVMIDYSSESYSDVEAPAFVSSLTIELQRKSDGGVVMEGESTLLPDFNDVVITQDIQIDNVELVTCSYIDILGNHYAFRWSWE